jgi:hypothetical protein
MLEIWKWKMRSGAWPIISQKVPKFNKEKV